MKGSEILIMPASLSAGFANRFSDLATFSGALPISHLQIARIGVLDARPTSPFPPILSIDGSERLETAPGLLPERDAPIMAEGYEADWSLLQDLMDMPPSAAEGPGVDPMELVLARDSGWFDFSSLREIIAAKDLRANAHGFFANAFGSAAIGILAPDTPGKEAREPEATTDFLEYAVNRFLEAAFLSRAADIEDSARVEKAFVQSAMGFALSDRFSAAAMMLEHAVDIQCRSGRPCVQTRTEEAKLWLAELGRGDHGSFEILYPRALNAAQHDHPGSGLMERIFEASAEYYLDTGDYAEAAKAILRKVWAQLMKIDLKSEPEFSTDDWFVTSIDLFNAASFFERRGLNAFSSMAKALGSEASKSNEGIEKPPWIEIISSRPPRPDDPTVNFRRSRGKGANEGDRSA